MSIKEPTLKDKFVITITDLNGSKHYHLNQLIKKIAFYIFAVIFFAVVVGIGYISFLQRRTDELKTNTDALAALHADLTAKNAAIAEQLRIRSEEFAAVEDKISTIEEQLGLSTPDDGATTFERLDFASLTAAQQHMMFAMVPNGSPMDHNGIASPFAWRIHPVLKTRTFHPAVDLRGPVGLPVYATADGVVEYAGYNATSGYGYMVILEHNFGFKTRFAHMMRKDVVKKGQFVKKGDLIGYNGSTGMTTGPHLHYEVRFIQQALDPESFLNWNNKNFNQIFEKETRVPWQSLITAVTSLIPKPQS